jgi:hypothetical protein
MGRLYGAVWLASLAMEAIGVAPPTYADEREPPVGAALGVGAALALAPLCAGGAMFANSDDVDVRRGGLYLGLTGLTLAPAVAHFAVGEPARAGWFSIAPVAGTALTVAMLESHPELLDHGGATVRVLFGAGLSLTVLGTVVGLADVPGASDRWRRRHGTPLRVVVAPVAAAGAGGVAVGGRF